jgi:hypothetical protein
MTSRNGSISKTFAIGCEIDIKAIERVNHQLLMLNEKDARNAMRRGLGKWSRFTKKTLEATAPFGRATATEYVRKAVRPNVHLKWSVITKVKGYSKGLVTWMAVGIKKIDGSYLTPHWYHGWLENGHLITRKATYLERAILMNMYGYKSKEHRSGKWVIGRSAPRNWIKKYRAPLSALAVRYVEPEVEKAIKDSGLG